MQKAPMKFSVQWLVERIVRETSLSEGDVRNVLITLRTTIPSKMLPKEEDVTAASLKKNRIIVRWKSAITDALKKIEVEVDNPKRKEKNKKPKP